MHWFAVCTVYIVHECTLYILDHVVCKCYALKTVCFLPVHREADDEGSLDFTCVAAVEMGVLDTYSAHA